MAAALLTAAPAAWCGSHAVVFRQGVSDGRGLNPFYNTEDSQLVGIPSSAASNAVPEEQYNWGGAPFLGLGCNFGRTNRLVFRFDLSSLRDRATTITAVRLVLIVDSAAVEGELAQFPTPLNVELYAIALDNVDWREGQAWAAAADAVCWNGRRGSGAPWVGKPGCGLAGRDFAGPPLAVAVGNQAFYQQGDQWVLEFSDPARFLELAQQPVANAGFLLRSSSLEAEAADNLLHLNFYSDDASQPDDRPALEIQYEATAAQEAQAGADRAWLGAP